MRDREVDDWEEGREEWGVSRGQVGGREGGVGCERVNSGP